MWGKNREKKGNRKSSRQKKPPQSPTAMPPLPPQPNGCERSNPAGCEDFPPWGPLPLAAAPGTATGKVERPSLLGAAAAQMGPGCRVEGRDKQSLTGLLGQGSERNQLLLAGGAEGREGTLETSRTKPRLQWSKWRWRRFLFVPLLIRVSLKPYSTQRVRKRGREGGAKMRVWGRRHR